MNQQRSYLDNAATSWPKPESVYQAIDRTQRTIGVSASRGSHQSSVEAGQIVSQVRRAIASLINAPSERNVAFTFSGTDALSTAIFGTLKDGDHVVTTKADHNSVLRPLQSLERSGTITLTIVPCDQTGLVSAESITDAMTDETAMVAVTHASNVLGTVNPVAEIGRACQTRDINFLLDAAQTAGHLPIDVQQMGCGMLAAPGHKGLYGPLGTGFLYVDPALESLMEPLRLGGTGSQRVDELSPQHMPSKLEAGSLNVPAIAGLLAGIEFITSDAGQQAAAGCNSLFEQLCQSLRAIKGVNVFGPHAEERAASHESANVIALSIDGVDSQTAAGILDSSFQVQTRAGFHCSPLLHQQIGTMQDGLIRISPGLFTTQADIDTVVAAIEQIAGSFQNSP